MRSTRYNLEKHKPACELTAQPTLEPYHEFHRAGVRITMARIGSKSSLCQDVWLEAQSPVVHFKTTVA